MAFALPAARQVHHDLPQSDLLGRALVMPTPRPTEYAASNVQTEVLTHPKSTTCIVAFLITGCRVFCAIIPNCGISAG